MFQENSNISTLISWNVRLFWILSFAKDMLLQKFDCVFVLAIRGLLHMTKNFVLWCDFLCVNHYYGIFFEKFSLKLNYHDFFKCFGFQILKSWCCRKHVFVFEIVSLKGLNKFMIKLSFSLWLLGKDFFFFFYSPLWKKVWKLFHFGSWLLSQASRKVLMCSLFLDPS